MIDYWVGYIIGVVIGFVFGYYWGYRNAMNWAKSNVDILEYGYEGAMMLREGNEGSL